MATDTQLLKGILEGCILALLKREPSYGYRVVERLRAFGFGDVAEATVYPILNRLEKKGELTFEKRPSALGPPRKYYGLTGAGEDALNRFAASWQTTSGIVERVLEEDDNETSQ